MRGRGDVRRPARSLGSSTTVARNVIARVYFGMVLSPGAGELARSDTARARSPNGVVARSQYQVPEYESAEPAEDHTLFLRRASRFSTLKAGIGTTPSPGNAHPNPHRYPIPNAFGWALRAHPCPSKSPSIPIQNAFGWAVGGPRRWRPQISFSAEQLLRHPLVRQRSRSLACSNHKRTPPDRI